jgi:hypothetical protein
MQPDSTDTTAEQAPATDAGTPAEQTTETEPTTSATGDAAQAPAQQIPSPFGGFFDHAAEAARQLRYVAMQHAAKLVETWAADVTHDVDEATTELLKAADKIHAWLQDEAGPAPEDTSTSNA